MKLVIHKYGGTSVGSIERIKAVARNIHRALQDDVQVVSVVSAMGQETDKLKQMAMEISPAPPRRELDMLLTAGERVTMALLSIALNELGIPSISLTGSQSGILTDTTHGNARITAILGDRIRQALEKRNVAIVAGFQGMSPVSKDVTTLGRGGSDLTAVALAHVLKAQACVLYKDVPGVCTADPRMVPSATVLNHLTWDDLSALSWSGAAVMHPRAAHLAAKYGVPLTIKSSFHFDLPGTKVSGRNSMESAHVTGLAYRKNVSLLHMVMACAQLKKQYISSVIEWLWRHGETAAVSQSRSHDDGRQEMLLAFDSHNVSIFKNWLNTELSNDNAQLLSESIQSGLAALTVVGQGFWHQPEKVAEIVKLFDGKAVMFETKNTAVTACLPEEDLQEVMKSLHQHILPEPSQA